MHAEAQIKQFLSGSTFAVVGASENREKYGNKVLRCYQQSGKKIYPIHPKADRVEGLVAFKNLTSLPESVHGISVITPPNVTTNVVAEAVALGIQNIWLQPGAESAEAIEKAKAADANLIAGGPCLLVALGYREP